MYLNKAFVLGNLTRDPEMKSLPSGIPVTNFSIATNKVWRDKDGNKKENAEFHNIVVFNRQAEIAAQYLRKGSSVLIEGRLQTRSWDGPDGNKRYRTEIVADQMQLGPRSEGGAPRSGSPAPQSAPQGGGTQQQEDLATIEYPEEDSRPEDIPF